MTAFIKDSAEEPILDENGLEYYGGKGFLGLPEIGFYEVSYEVKEDNQYVGKHKRFKSLSKAIKFYQSLKSDKAIWQRDPIPELLECHTNPNTIGEKIALANKKQKQ